MNRDEFKKQAKTHQKEWKKYLIGLEYEYYETWLTETDAIAGKNFYDSQNEHGFGIFEAVKKRYPRFKKTLYADILRSEHIPFNLFIPFRKNLDFCKKVFNEILGNIIEYIPLTVNINYIKKINDISVKKEINVPNIIIEYAPSPKEEYLNDGTAFDTYIEFFHKDGSKGLLGIEVKYTEEAYRLTKQSQKEEFAINDKTSNYYKVSRESGIFNMETIELMKEDDFRQIWRNQLLAESVKLRKKEIKHAYSLLLYPKDNGHFATACDKYQDFLAKRDSFVPITYESFFDACSIHCPDANFRDWLNYLTNRYIIKK